MLSATRFELLAEHGLLGGVAGDDLRAVLRDCRRISWGRRFARIGLQRQTYTHSGKVDLSEKEARP